LNNKIILGISSCLLGENVRYDGGHKRDNYICDTLVNYFDFLPICPEVAIGMSIPRPAVHLVGEPNNPSLVEAENKEKNYTQLIQQFASKTMDDLTGISGYILKSKSPSCGWRRVKVYQQKDMPFHNGQGLFAAILEKCYPNLPIEEESRLNDDKIRENFIERVFIYKKWQELTSKAFCKEAITAFHTQHELTLMAHHLFSYRKLGKMVAAIDQPLETFYQQYIFHLMKALNHTATKKKHANVLQHCMGYLKKKLSPIDKEELQRTIDNYRLGLTPLIVPITLLRHHLNHYPNEHLNLQSYLNPYPEELMLRNHI
jgi:uncharacterized protein YbgA (DUF1722 family)/uncharacterized protein YbbK (DUF523 family)